jgi:dihydroorotase
MPSTNDGTLPPVNELQITRPDDWHVHLRDDVALGHTCADMARYFGRAIVMPNLTPPVTNVDQAGTYRSRIMRAQEGLARRFEPLMVLYLTDQTSAADIAAAAACDFVYAVKLYPAGATTNSEAGVAELEALYPTLAAMEQVGLPLLIHGEVTDADIDIFDREKVFIDRHLQPITRQFPALKVVLEHITTSDAIQFVRSAAPNVAATITAHHLLYNRNHMLVGGIRPHYYCLPILKRKAHQAALIEAATSGDPQFFLGTDSAPHGTTAKETACGCAGCYTAHAAIELYAEVFEAASALDKLEAFASFHGPDFYALPRNEDRITLRREAWQMPLSLPLGDSQLTPLRAGEQVLWKIIS